MKRFLFSLFVLMTTTLFATNANASEMASLTQNSMMEVPANLASPKEVHVKEITIVIEYEDGSIEIHHVVIIEP